MSEHWYLRSIGGIRLENGTEKAEARRGVDRADAEFDWTKFGWNIRHVYSQIDVLG